MAATVQQVRDLMGATYASISDGEITAALTEAALHMHAETWGDRYSTGQALLAAHFLADAFGGSGGGSFVGIVTQTRLGPAGKMYATPGVSVVQNDPLNLRSSRFGRRYLALAKTITASPMVAGDALVPGMLVVDGGWCE